MRYRQLGFLLALVPGLAVAQHREHPKSADHLRDDASAVKARDLDGTNAATRAVLLANRPKDMSEADWLKLMANPVNATLYPLRITQAMLDTLDAAQLDLRYPYVLVKQGEMPGVGGR